MLHECLSAKKKSEFSVSFAMRINFFEIYDRGQRRWLSWWCLPHIKKDPNGHAEARCNSVLLQSKYWGGRDKADS